MTTDLSANCRTEIFSPAQNNAGGLMLHWMAGFSPVPQKIIRRDFKVNQISYDVDGTLIRIEDLAYGPTNSEYRETEGLNIGDSLYVSDLYDTSVTPKLRFKAGIYQIRSITHDSGNNYYLGLADNFNLFGGGVTIDDSTGYCNVLKRDYKVRIRFKTIAAIAFPSYDLLNDWDFWDLVPEWFEITSPPDGNMVFDLSRVFKSIMTPDIDFDFENDEVVKDSHVINAHIENMTATFTTVNYAGNLYELTSLVYAPDESKPWWMYGVWANHSILQRAAVYSSEVVNWKANNLFEYQIVGHSDGIPAKFLTPFQEITYWRGWPLTVNVLTMFWADQGVENGYELMDNFDLAVRACLKCYYQDGTDSTLIETVIPYDGGAQTIEQMVQLKFVINNIFDIPENAIRMEFWLQSITDLGGGSFAYDDLTEHKVIKVAETCDNAVMLMWRNNLGGESWWQFSNNQEVDTDYPAKERRVETMRLFAYVNKNERDAITEMNSVAPYFQPYNKTLEDTKATDTQMHQKVYIVESDGVTKQEVINVITKSAIETKHTMHAIEVNIQLPEVYTK